MASAFVESAIGSTAALEALVSRLYKRAPDSLAHLTRVARLTSRIGGELGMAALALDDLERAALLHDVGRLVLPDMEGVSADAIDQVAMLHRANQVGLAFDLVKDVTFLKPAATIVKYSLECYDGSGLPIGLRGHDIPLGSRVLHVADTLDALTSVCVALACSVDAANAELVRMAGARFDPEVVAAWLRCADLMPPPTVAWWPAAERMN